MQQDKINEITRIKDDPEEKLEPDKQSAKPKDLGKVLTQKMKSLIFWIGTIFALISAIAYIIMIIIMCVGFKFTGSLASNIVFSIITALIGLIISQSLKMQGISFAKNEPDVKEVWDKFYRRDTKKRKHRSLTFFWVKSIAFDILFKSVSIAVLCVGAVYVFVSANGDIMRVFMALFNLTLFAGFGMMSLTKAYDFTKEQHVAWMIRQMKLEQEAENEMPTP